MKFQYEKAGVFLSDDGLAKATVSYSRDLHDQFSLIIGEKYYKFSEGFYKERDVVDSTGWYDGVTKTEHLNIVLKYFSLKKSLLSDEKFPEFRRKEDRDYVLRCIEGVFLAIMKHNAMRSGINEGDRFFEVKVNFSNEIQQKLDGRFL